ncbi:hypothetical protein NDU88_002898 [Pleurodeles waltl]|uniref:Uncharacterized protein n=1 Tax=Pleurodeles waltl TaxID=8319 RepID=A0AAV7UYK0_PLEWA|nr:hypothetical protein NDU88_002898 [Pleurodeles waltl]
MSRQIGAGALLEPSRLGRGTPVTQRKRPVKRRSRSSARPGEEGAEVAGSVGAPGHWRYGGDKALVRPSRALGCQGQHSAPHTPTLPIKQQTEPELHASARADPAVSRIGEIKQKRGDLLPPYPLLGRRPRPDRVPAAEAWPYTGADFHGLLLPAAAYRSPSLPTERSVELKLATALWAGPQRSVRRPRAGEREPPR